MSSLVEGVAATPQIMVPDDFLDFLWTTQLADEPFTRSQAGMVTNVAQSHMIELWVKSCKLTGTITNSANASCVVTMYYLQARENIDETPQSVYAACVSGTNKYQGFSGVGVGNSATEQADITDPGVKLWSFPPILQCYRVYKTKKFVLEPSMIRTFKLSDRKPFHVTTRMSGLSACRRSKFIIFEVMGQAMGSSASTSTVVIGPNTILLQWEKTYQFEQKPVVTQTNNLIPYVDIGANTPAWMVCNNPTDTHTYVAA